MKRVCVRITEGLYVEVFWSSGKVSRSSILRSCKGSEFLEVFREYLEGKGDVRLPLQLLDFSGYESRVIKVYRYLKKHVPPGDRITYSQLGELTGEHPRFVAYCMRINRFPVIIPCHRVVSKKGLGGFSYGTDIKKRLLEMEIRRFRSDCRRA